MRSIILTDNQYAELTSLLEFAYTQDVGVSEPLWREIKDIKRCKTCKHWIKNPDEICEVWRNTEEIYEGEGKNVLDCWERPR